MYFDNAERVKPCNYTCSTAHKINHEIQSEITGIREIGWIIFGLVHQLLRETAVSFACWNVIMCAGRRIMWKYGIDKCHFSSSNMSSAKNQCRCNLHLLTWPKQFSPAVKGFTGFYSLPQTFQFQKNLYQQLRSKHPKLFTTIFQSRYNSVLCRYRGNTSITRSFLCFEWVLFVSWLH